MNLCTVSTDYLHENTYEIQIFTYVHTKIIQFKIKFSMTFECFRPEKNLYIPKKKKDEKYQNETWPGVFLSKD